jgi:hypothetical protein
MRAITIAIGREYEKMAEISAELVERFTGLKVDVYVRKEEGCYSKGSYSGKCLSAFDDKLEICAECEETLMFFDADWMMIRPWSELGSLENTEFFHAPTDEYVSECRWTKHDAGILDLPFPYLNTAIFFVGDKGPIKLAKKKKNSELGLEGKGEQSRINWALKELGTSVKLLPKEMNCQWKPGREIYDGLIGLHISVPQKKKYKYMMQMKKKYNL